MVPEVKIWSPSVDQLTPRHHYVVHVVFEVVLGWPAVWCDQESAWKNGGDLHICYGGTPNMCGDEVLWIPDSGLLSRSGVEEMDWQWSDAELTPGGKRLPFGVSHGEGNEIHADWWSWVFWMAARMEEQVEGHELKRDRWGRFQGDHSLAHAEGWLKRPNIERVVRDWASAATRFMPSNRQYEARTTMDVDSAFAYLHKGPWLTLGAAIHDLFKGRWKRFLERPRVLWGSEPDPYDTYKWIEEQHAKFGLRTHYFMLLADRSPKDRGVPFDSKGMRRLISYLTQVADVSIHPSFESHESTDSRTLKSEINRLGQLNGNQLDDGRQHYLLQRFPGSWKRLEACGIHRDHSLGYADQPGFRSGLSRPFRAYDMEDERIMDLWLHPIAIMDATLIRYLNLSSKEALQVVRSIQDEVEQVQGILTLLWHNESVSNRWEWEGWREFYKEVLQVVHPK
jgi:hypothetical protein